MTTSLTSRVIYLSLTLLVSLVLVIIVKLNVTVLKDLSYSVFSKREAAGYASDHEIDLAAQLLYQQV